MIISLLIIFGFLVLTIIFLYFRKKEIFDKYIRLIEIIAVVFSVFFVLIQFQSSTDDFNDLIGQLKQIFRSADESREALKSVDESLSNLPTQIDSFSNSITTLDEVISEQKDQLSQTLVAFNESIYDFKSSVDSMAKRFNRKPDLKIDLITSKNDTSVTIHEIVLTNIGSLLAEVYLLRVQLPTDQILNVGNKKLKKDTEFGILSTYQEIIRPSWPIDAHPKRPGKFDCYITLKNEYFEVVIFVYYRASFGNDGNEYQAFQYRDHLNKLVKIELE